MSLKFEVHEVPSKMPGIVKFAMGVKFQDEFSVSELAIEASLLSREEYKNLSGDQMKLKILRDMRQVLIDEGVIVDEENW